MICVSQYCIVCIPVHCTTGTQRVGTSEGAPHVGRRILLFENSRRHAWASVDLPAVACSSDALDAQSLKNFCAAGPQTPPEPRPRGGRAGSAGSGPC